jgi:hypothetical protein
MLRILAVAIAIGFMALCPVEALAQYGYPAGYGGYGWGGWGSTPQSSLARGLGYFNLGRGAYNENTAVARSINTDTVMRWNQYMYLSHVAAANRYHARLQAEKYHINELRAELHDQLRNHPSNRDITDSDALNVLLDEILNTSVAGLSLSQIKMPVKPELIQEIPFKFASEGMTICLDQMTLKDTWPLALRVEVFRPEREGLRKAILTALEEDKEGDLEPKTIEAVSAAIERLRLKFQELVPQSSPEYVPAHDTIKAIAGITKMLYSPRAEEILAELEKYQGTTLGELLSFMQAFNLRFAAANSYHQRQLYLKLYPLLAGEANSALAARSTSAPPAAAGAVQNGQTGPGQAVRTAENLGDKAFDGLRSAAVDFFKDMDWKHLNVSGKPSRP